MWAVTISSPFRGDRTPFPGKPLPFSFFWLPVNPARNRKAAFETASRLSLPLLFLLLPLPYTYPKRCLRLAFHLPPQETIPQISPETTGPQRRLRATPASPFRPLPSQEPEQVLFSVLPSRQVWGPASVNTEGSLEIHCLSRAQLLLGWALLPWLCLLRPASLGSRGERCVGRPR